MGVKTLGLGVAGFVMLLGGVAAADEKKDPVAYCSTVEELAKGIMTARQAGASMSKVMAVAQQQEIPELKTIMTIMVSAAYKKPQYSTDGAKAREITDFSNNFAAFCFSSMGVDGTGDQAAPVAEEAAKPQAAPAPAKSLSDDECKWLIDAWTHKRSVDAIHKYGGDTSTLLADCKARGVK